MTKDTAILLLERTKLSYCGKNNSSVLSFAFLPEVVRDLDIINKEQFITQLTAFIDTNKILPATIVIILTDDVLFEKDIIQEQPTKAVLPKKTSDIEPTLEEETKQFLNTVPFEKIAHRTYQLDKGVRIIAANQDLYETIKHIFESKQSHIDAIVPLFAIARLVGNTLALTPNLVKLLYGKLDMLRQQTLPLTFIEPIIKPAEPEGFTLTLKGNGNSKRLFAMIGVFVLLFGVMVVMYLTMYAPSQTTTTQIHASPKITIAIPPVFSSPTYTPVPTLSTIASASGIMANAKIHIITDTGVASQAAKLKNAFVTDGFNTIILTNQTGSGSKTLITFTHNLTQTTRDKILNEVQKLTPNFSIQETNDTEFDAIISLF